MTRRKPIRLPKPELWVGHFIFDELKKYEDVGIFENQSTFPFIPSTSSQTSIDGLRSYISTQNGGGESSTISIFKYDTLIRFRAQGFYPIRKEQMIIEFMTDEDYGASRNIESIITYLLDREDESAKDLNAWAAQNSGTVGLEYIDANGDEQTEPCNVFFHRTKVFKINERRDIADLESVNLPEVASKIIVEFDYTIKRTEFNYSDNDITYD